MRPTPASALLATANGPAPLSALAAELGFDHTALPLDDESSIALGLHETPLQDPHVIRGPGTLRALTAWCNPKTPLRDAVATTARRLAQHAPHLHWLLLLSHNGAPGVAIATFTPTAKPRIAALVADRSHILQSDTDTLTALAAVPAHSDILTHSAWLDILGREALTRRFYRTLEYLVEKLAANASGHATPHERSELALLNVSRLLFLGFLESRGWLDGDHRFLANGFTRCIENGGHYHHRVLLPLFFGTLNTSPRRRAPAARCFGRVPFLNGGLFTRTALERRHADIRFPDDTLGAIIGELLGGYRFSAREENDGTWSEAAIDPEMLGKAFESLMDPNARRESGAFYTPRRIVTTVTRSALRDALANGSVAPDLVDAALHGDPLPPRDADTLLAHVHTLAILDPACGSGAFLVHALESLATLHRRLGDPRSIAGIRRDLLTRVIFGVDVNPTAVWLCALRLWLSVVIESEVTDPLAVPPLPNLDRHIRVGDALSGDAFVHTTARRGARHLTLLRQRYARATGPRKHTLQRELDRAERNAAISHIEEQLARCAARRRDLLTTLRSRDLFGARQHHDRDAQRQLTTERTRTRELRATLRRIRDGGALPFAWTTQFADVAQRGGFDIIFGNPPWVRIHRIPPAARAEYRRHYAAYRNAAWTPTAHPGRRDGFASQVDLSALFTERTLALLRPNGTLALLLPAKLWRSLAGGGIRRVLHERARLVSLEDWSHSPSPFEAAVYPSLLVARRTDSDRTSHIAAVPRTRPPSDDSACFSAHERAQSVCWSANPSTIALDESAGSPWITVPPPVRTAFDTLSAIGTPLSHSPLGAPILGVKCGCNDAFVVEVVGGDHHLATVRSGNIQGSIERSLIRPLLRGEATEPWRPSARSEWIVWTHHDNGAVLATLPQHTHRWLGRWRKRLLQRSDAHGRTPWWSLFRTRAARSHAPRVVWADLGRSPRALVLLPGDLTVPLNTCYVLPCHEVTDAHALAALLNSPLAAAWLNVIAEPARGAYYRYLAWTVALLPIPRDWTRARDCLAPLAARARAGNDPTPSELLTAAADAYRTPLRTLAPLLTWTSR